MPSSAAARLPPVPMSPGATVTGDGTVAVPIGVKVAFESCRCVRNSPTVAAVKSTTSPRLTDGSLVRPSEKTGFCLGDRYEAEAEVEGKPAQADWTDECGRDQPGLLSVRQGISPGYGDDYDPGLEGQFVDVTNVPGLDRAAFVGGARIGRLWAFAPPAGAALSVTLVSHERTCCLGLACDQRAVADPELLATCLDEGLDEVLHLGRTAG